MKVPHREELVQIFEAIPQNSPFGARDRALLVLGANTGLRVSELSGLDVNHVMRGDQVRPSFDVQRQWAKGAHSRPVPLNAAAAKAILAILRFNQMRGFSTTPDAPLLQDRWHRRLPARSIQRMLQKYRELADVREVTPHKLRHFFATRVLARKANIRCLQALMGHQRVETTEAYTHVDPADLRQAVGP